MAILLVFSFNQVGYNLLLCYSQYQWKESVKKNIVRRLRNDDLEIISLADNQRKIYWQEEGKEFLLNGEMYDVVKTGIVNGRTVLYCINDKKEKKLIDDYTAATRRNPDRKVRALGFLLLYIDTGEDAPFAGGSASTGFATIISPLPENIEECISPPPKV